MMKSSQKHAGAFASLSLLLGLTLLGVAGCSDDAPSDPTPDLFTPSPGSTPETASLRLFSVREAPMPSKGATLFLVGVKLNLDSQGKDADFTRSEIVDCLVTVTHDGEELVSDSSVVTQQGAEACRAIDEADDLGTLLLGTPRKSGSMTFAIKFYDFERKLTVRGSVTAPVQPGTTVPAELVATPVP